jgi:hypothetical protein
LPSESEDQGHSDNLSDSDGFFAQQERPLSRKQMKTFTKTIAGITKARFTVAAHDSCRSLEKGTCTANADAIGTVVVCGSESDCPHLLQAATTTANAVVVLRTESDSLQLDGAALGVVKKKKKKRPGKRDRDRYHARKKLLASVVSTR